MSTIITIIIIIIIRCTEGDMVKYIRERGSSSWQVTGIRHARPRNHFVISRGNAGCVRKRT